LKKILSKPSQEGGRIEKVEQSKMDKSTVEFEPAAWATNGAKPSLSDAPPRLTAEIVSPKGHLQFEGAVVASRVESGDARLRALGKIWGN
jgi:hypothetical protein